MSTIPKPHRVRRAATAAERVLTPAFRRWAYGLTIAVFGVVVFAGWLPPEALPVLAPVAMALLYVDHNGDPRP